MSQKHLNSANVGHFKHTADCETVNMPIPDVVKIPLSQHIGAPCKPLVAKGDYVKVGQLIGDTDAFVSAPIHSSVSGTVTGIEEVRSMMGGWDTLVVIEPDKKQELWEGLHKPEAADLAEFVKEIRNSGIVGMGGASFPTHIKFNPKNIDEVDTLIVNAAECEPFITSDHRCMLEDANDLLDGVELCMKYIGLDKGYIGIEENKMNAVNHLNELIKERGIQDKVQTFVLQARYPKGAERVLVYEVTGKTMDAGVLPAQLGIILSNVTTIMNVGKYWRTGIPVMEKRVTLDGDAIANPGNFNCVIGTQIADIVEFSGGYKGEPRKIVMGGPMMGRAVLTDANPVVKNSNAVLCFTEKMAVPPKETACINCGRCHTVCAFELLPVALSDAYAKRDVELLQELRVMQCMECSSCSFICPAHRPLGFTNKLAKALVKEAGNK